MAMYLVRGDEKHISFSIKQEDFRTVAIRNHADQRYGPYPYSIHLAMIEDSLVSNGYDTFEDRAGAWLHDTIEDTKLTYELIFKLFGKEVADIVDACTGEGETRAIRNQSIYDKIKKFPRAAPVKVADRIINMKFSYITQNYKQLEKYINEFPTFSDALRPIMTETKQGSLYWNTLEDIVSLGMIALREKTLAKEKDAA